MGCAQATGVALPGSPAEKAAPSANGAGGAPLAAEPSLQAVAPPAGSTGSSPGQNHGGGSRTPASSSQAAPGEPRGLAPGTEVRICGLTSAPRLNGESGTCLHWDHSTNRWHVRLRDGEVKALRPENLQEVPTAASSTAAKQPSTAPSQAVVEPGDPPLLKVWEGDQPAPESSRAEAARRLLNSGLGIGRSFPEMDLLPEFAEAAKNGLGGPEGPGPAEGEVPVDPDEQLLSTVEDERVILYDLDKDLQLGSLGGRLAATARG